MDYEDPVQMIRDCHQHVLDTGHQIVPGDDPVRQFMGYVCIECEGLFWYCSARSLKALEGRSMEAELLRDAIFSHEARKRFNSRTLPRPAVVLSRYERPWVI